MHDWHNCHHWPHWPLTGHHCMGGVISPSPGITRVHLCSTLGNWVIDHSHQRMRYKTRSDKGVTLVLLHWVQGHCVPDIAILCQICQLTKTCQTLSQFYFQYIFIHKLAKIFQNQILFKSVYLLV